MSARPKSAPQPLTYTLSDAASSAQSDTEELRDELQEWYDNLPENFQNGDKGSQLQEAIGYLDDAANSMEEPDLDADEMPSFQFTPSTKKRMSRSDRRHEIVALLDGACDRAREYANELRDAVEEKKANGEFGHEDQGTFDTGMYESAQEAADDKASEIEAWADDVEGAKDTLESVEFPGMFG